MRSKRPAAGGRRAGFTIVEMLVVVSIIGVLMGLIMTGVVAARQAAGRSHTRLIIKQIEFAIERYQSDWGDFPPGEGALAGAEQLRAALTSPRNPGTYVTGNSPPAADPEATGRQVFVDHWKRAIYYTHHRHYSGEPNADTYRLQSPGLDGRYNTDDDLTNWKK